MTEYTELMKAITSGFQGVNKQIGELEGKVGTVVETVQKLTSKCDKQGENLNDLKEKFSKMETELKETRKEVEILKVAPRSFASVTALRTDENTGAGIQGNEETSRSESRVDEAIRKGEGEREKVKEPSEAEKIRTICEKARRTVGFFKIGEDDIKRMYGEAVPYGGAENREQALLLAVREFMDMELKIKREEQANMIIEDLFERKSEELDTVYVRFKYRSSISKIFEKVKILRKDSQIITYIPKEFQDRFKGLNEALKVIRSEGEGCRTRVKMGMRDLTVSKKPKQMGAVYEELKMNMEDLPPVCLTRARPKETSSPPPGRPSHQDERNKRRKSRQSQGESPLTKTARQEQHTDNTEETEVEVEEHEENRSGEAQARGNQSNVTQRKNKGNIALCGSPTISPVKTGEGLLARPSMGEVSEVVGRQGGQEKVIRQADSNSRSHI